MWKRPAEASGGCLTRCFSLTRSSGDRQNKMRRSLSNPMFRLSSISALAVCAAALVFSPMASAQAKIAVIDLRRAILETAEIKKASNDLQNKYKPRQDALEKAQRELSDLEAQMQASQGRLSPQGEADLTARGKRKQTEVQRLSQDLQDDVNH